MKVFLLLMFMSTPACAHSESSSRAGNEGDACGGFVGLRCKEHLICMPTNPTVVDSYGVCVAK